MGNHQITKEDSKRGKKGTESQPGKKLR